MNLEQSYTANLSACPGKLVLAKAFTKIVSISELVLQLIRAHKRPLNKSNPGSYLQKRFLRGYRCDVTLKRKVLVQATISGPNLNSRRKTFVSARGKSASCQSGEASPGPQLNNFKEDTCTVLEATPTVPWLLRHAGLVSSLPTLTRSSCLGSKR